ncbi:MAG: hypothetical protein IJH36_05315 [Clostridia bacterium]|nr:hypothetical protein [Clostridia bacterium]
MCARYAVFSLTRQYAAENNIAYVVTDADMFILGDANQNMVTDVSDATKMQRYLAEFEVNYPIGNVITK